MIICGIDEAGRGPLAGPLAVAGCILTKQVKGLNDSKKLTEKQRERLFEEIVSASKYHIALFDAKEIDSNGLSSCIKSGLLQIKSALSADKYIFDMESKFSVYYDSNYLMIDSFEYEVLKNNLIHTKCIEKGNAPASSYHGVISWYNKFNVAGCNVTKVTIGFKVIDPEIDLSNITEILSLHEE